MIVGSSVRRKGTWETAADTITLDETMRHRRRMAMVSDGGIAFLLDLPEARLLMDGDAILLDDGRLVAVLAKPEPLYAVTAHGPRDLLALAWQIGNRHLPTQIEAGRLLIRRDPVIAEMLRGLGAHVDEVEAQFNPEGGAYGGTPEAHAHPHEH
ncbi:urease accessory protein UreE [Aurantimonas sp. Leaf443]|uniref:urease accessory protein UreE n=1 Tax=Aurantimonas sp. Leaf443 TaxID=1736378 RepID=UPI0007019C08|nr:urease accessory protein UreE [Aurantimonas sp. Leaf443]KQT85200.1 urease accessory protein UreE [Aurantimonas sp. Leaf443]